MTISSSSSLYFEMRLPCLTNEALGNTKQAVAKDSSRLDAEGKAQERKGEAQDTIGTVKGKLGDDI